MHVWIKKISNTTGKTYYVNILTRESVWTVPKNECRLSPILEEFNYDQNECLKD
jgi:hypothetical protein